jgi:predicted ferric reductase
MAFEFALISRVRSVSRAFGQDALAQFHRLMGIVALFFILTHPALLLPTGLDTSCGVPIIIPATFPSFTVWKITNDTFLPNCS